MYTCKILSPLALRYTHNWKSPQRPLPATVSWISISICLHFTSLSPSYGGLDCCDIINQMGHSHHEPCLSSFENTIAIWMVSTMSDSDCSHEIKRRLLFGRKVMTNLDSIETLLCQQRSVWSRLWFFQWSCMDVRVGLWRKLSAEKLMLLNYGVGEDSWESLRLQGDPTSPSWRRSVLGVHWKDWWWNWNSSTLATSCEELTHRKKPWCWEGLGAGGEGDDREWDGWMASPTRWMWVWVNSGSWWRTGMPGVLQFMRSQRVGHDWATELN